MSKGKKDGRGKSTGSRRTQFKKGDRGNSAGRPKGARNTRTIFNKAASEKIVVREGEKVRKRDMRETIIREDLKNAARGKSQAVDRFYKNADRYQRDDEEENYFDIEEDKIIVTAFLDRYEQRKREGGA